MSLEKCPIVVPTVIIDEDKVLDIRLTSQKTKDPFDLTSATEIEAIFINADNTYLIKKLTLAGIVLISGPGGHFQVILTSAETALLAPSIVGGYSDIEIHITIAGKLTIVILSQSFLCIERRYPGA